MDVKVYVSSPFHKKHKFKKVDRYVTPFGLMDYYKCEKCGDVKIDLKDRKSRRS